MKLVNFKVGEQIRLGIKYEQGIVDVEIVANANFMDVPITMEQVIARGEKGLSLLKKKP